MPSRDSQRLLWITDRRYLSLDDRSTLDIIAKLAEPSPP